MAYDGKYLAQARAALEKRRAANQEEQARRTKAVYARIPRIRQLDETLRAQMLELLGLTMRRGADPGPEIEALEKENLALQAERAELLTAHGLPADYTDDIYTCPVCRDTGYLRSGSPCSCLKKLCNQAMTAALSGLLSGTESFANFDLTLYDDGPGNSPRKQMEKTFRFCRSYAEAFCPGAPNLLLQGGTGLGKTFLSACIARVVAARGFSVAYASAADALGAFELSKFQRGTPEGADAAARAEQYLCCDLMILDDLGTEMVTPFSVSALYTLINTRLTQHRPAILSTNLTDAGLAAAYSPQILSRIEGEYLALPFAGEDIRRKRKNGDL